MLSLIHIKHQLGYLPQCLTGTDTLTEGPAVERNMKFMQCRLSDAWIPTSVWTVSFLPYLKRQKKEKVNTVDLY